jgi:acyl-CoA reductase-like NAD-dependent aldehyde dehydrogenase
MRGEVVTMKGSMVNQPIDLECIVDGSPAAPDGYIPIHDVCGNAIAQAPDLSAYELGRAVRVARRAKRDLDALSYRALCEIFRQAADYYSDAFDVPIALARGGTLMRVMQGRANAQAILRSFDRIVEHAFAGRLVQSKTGELAASHYHDPVGVVTLIPASTAREIAPWAVLSALAVGNTVVAKLDSKEPFSVVELELALRRAGLPPGALNTVFWNTQRMPDAGPRLLQITDKAVIFGWDHTIRRLAYQHLGDKLDEEILQHLPIPPNIVAFGTGRSRALLFDVTDMDGTARSLARAATFASSECLKVQLVVVQEELREKFLAAYQRAMTELRPGPLTDPATNVSQTAQEDRAFVRLVVDDAFKHGARKLLGGDVMCEPTVFDRLHEESLMFKEETPAPTLGLLTRRTLDDAIDLINRSVSSAESKRALAVAVYTDNDTVHRQCLTKIQAFRITRSTPPIDVDHLCPHQGILLARELTTIKGGR